MKNTFLKFAVLIFASVILNNCDVNDATGFQQEYVVESYLFAREPLPELRLSKTVPFGEAYFFNEQAVGNAQVSVSRLDENGTVEESYAYREIDRGVYMPESNDIVLPLHTYLLEIEIPDENSSRLSSTTFVPDSFSIVAANADTVVFQSTAQLEIDVTRSFVPTRQSVFVFSIEAQDVRFENFTPFYQDIFDEDEDDVEDFRVNESPLINEGNYDENPDGTLTIKLPWLAVAFYGNNDITLFAVDDNMFDFISSQNLQAEPSTLSPGEIPAVIDPIEGGTGIFGSYARVKTSVHILEPGI